MKTRCNERVTGWLKAPNSNLAWQVSGSIILHDGVLLHCARCRRTRSGRKVSVSVSRGPVPVMWSGCREGAWPTKPGLYLEISYWKWTTTTWRNVPQRPSRPWPDTPGRCPLVSGSYPGYSMWSWWPVPAGGMAWRCRVPGPQWWTRWILQDRLTRQESDRVCKWWRHDMETLSVLLAICVGNPPVTRDSYRKDEISIAELWCFICVRRNRLLKNGGVVGELRRHGVHVTPLSYEGSPVNMPPCARTGHLYPFTMMTSSNGTLFSVTGHLCGEFTGHRWISRTKASDADLDVFFDLRLNKRLSKQSWGWWLWRHCNDNITEQHT